MLVNRFALSAWGWLAIDYDATAVDVGETEIERLVGGQPEFDAQIVAGSCALPIPDSPVGIEQIWGGRRVTVIGGKPGILVCQMQVAAFVAALHADHAVC